MKQPHNQMNLFKSLTNRIIQTFNRHVTELQLTVRLLLRPRSRREPFPRGNRHDLGPLKFGFDISIHGRLIGFKHCEVAS